MFRPESPTLLVSSLSGFVVLTLLLAPTKFAYSEDDSLAPSAEAMNWKPLSELSPEELSNVPSNCCGAYSPPEREETVSEIEATKFELNGSYIIYTDNFNGNTNTSFTASGNVRVENGQQTIRAEEITVNQEQESSEITGPIVINEENALFLGQKAQVNQESGAARIEDGYFVLYESRIRGGAGVIDRDENLVMTLNDGEITQCEPGSDDWAIKGSQIRIDPNTEKGTVRNMRLEVGGIPVVYMPYWTFPAGKGSQSGFLFPSIKLRDNHLSDLSVPYFFALAPNYDLIVAPRYLKERGMMIELEGRYLNRHFDTMASTAWLGNGKDGISDNEQEAIDRLLADPATVPDAAALFETATEFDGEDRWLVGIEQNGGSRSDGPRQSARLFGTDLPRWYSQIDFTKASDFAFFRHVDTSNLNINRQTHLRQQGDVGYEFDDWTVNLHAEAYQSITVGAEEPYRQLPKLEIDGEYQWPLANGNINFEANNEFTSFRHGDEFYNDNPSDPYIAGERARLDYKLNWDRRWLWGFFKPGIALKNLSYRLDPDTIATTADEEPSIAVPQATLDGGLFFERDGSWFGSDYLQTFEPRVFYFYSRFEDHSDFYNISPNNRSIDFDTNQLTFGYSQLFRDTRFAGGDRIDDGNQYSIGLTTRFLSKLSGQEALSLSLGQIFYNEDRKVTLTGNPNDNIALQSKSEIAGQIAAQLTDSWRLIGDGLFDPGLHQWNQRNLNLRYYSEEGNIFNVGYRHQRNPSSTPQNNRDQEQANISLVLPLIGSWNVIGHTFHDFTNEEAMDSMLGVEYTSCCYRVRLLARRWFDNDLIERIDIADLEHERGVFFEFQLRGLGNIFDTIDGVLSESIYNYERREEDLR